VALRNDEYDTRPDEVVIKADVLGRLHTTRERWEQLLDEFERSGLTGQKLATVVGIPGRF
jgi:hypothetical protein